MQRLAPLLLRAFLRLPRWLRPPVAGAVVVLAAMGLKALVAVPRLARGEAGLGELLLAAGAAAGAAFLGGLGLSLSRPALRPLGRAGDLAAGVVTIWAYLGALLLASPLVFERSAIPEDAAGWAIWGGMATVIGLVAGLSWFGPKGWDGDARERAAPVLHLLEDEDDPDAGQAVLVSAWVRSEELAALCETLSELGRELGLEAPGAPSTAQDVDRWLRGATVEDDLVTQLPWSVPVPLRLSLETRRLVRFGVLLHGPVASSAPRIAEALRALTVDPLSAA